MSNLIDISSKTRIEKSGLIFNFDIDTISQPEFLNGTTYSDYQPIINKVFHDTGAINGSKINNCDFMTYMFPTSNTIQFSNGANQINTYSTQYIHFTSVCPVKITSVDIQYSIIIECSSQTVQPLLIIIPVSTSTTGSNVNVDNLIKHTQSSPNSVSSTTDTSTSVEYDVYLNNIIPQNQKFYYFNKLTPTETIQSCDIIIFPTSIFTKFSQLKYDVTPKAWADVTEITNLLIPSNSLIPPQTIAYVPLTEDVYTSTNYASNVLSVIENDIYIDCSVVEDTATTKTTKTITLKKPNTGIFILILIVIFISSSLIYMWIFRSTTVITSKKLPISSAIKPT